MESPLRRVLLPVAEIVQHKDHTAQGSLPVVLNDMRRIPGDEWLNPPADSNSQYEKTTGWKFKQTYKFMSVCLSNPVAGWWLQTFVYFPFHIWDFNPSH